MTDQPNSGVGGHYGDHVARPVWEPKRYASDLGGQGRWCTLEAPLGHPVAILFTDDHERLGYLQVADDQAAVTFVEALQGGLLNAAAQGSPTTAVFDWWAGRASQALAAGQVHTGALADLATTRR